jgi:putative tricarboxylic transport membrane protein
MPPDVVQPDMLHVIFQALSVLLEPERLMVLITGVLIGLALGCVPGLGGVVALAVLIPFTYHMDAISSFALLLGMAAVTTSSDLIPAILFGVPGTVGAAATVIDGHQMARNGEAGRAFGAGFASSLFGGIIGAIILALSVPVLRPVMLAVGAPELLMFAVFGLSMVATLSGKAPLKGMSAAGLGLMLSMIGTGMQTGVQRWTFSQIYLFDGLPLVPVTLGLFAIPELADLAVARRTISGGNTNQITVSSQWQGVRDVMSNWWLVLRCSTIGTCLGAIPGLGSAVIDWIVYGYAVRTEKRSETFGLGDVRGVIAPESSNNAKEGGHLVPTIAFGVPAGTSMTLLLGAFLMHGLVPGPEMLSKHLSVTYSIMWSLTLAHVIGAVICIFGSRYLAKLAEIPYQVMLPIIVPIVFIASFEGSRDIGDLFALLAFGVVGWVMKRLGWPRPPMVLGFVIGKIFERYLYISTELYGAAWLLRPVVLGLLAMIAWALYRPLRQIVAHLIHEFRHLSFAQLRFGIPSIIAASVTVISVVALITSSEWPVQEQLVGRTASYAVLVTSLLNLISEVFGAEQGSPRKEGAAHAKIAHSYTEDLPVPVVRRRAAVYFAWMIAFIAMVLVIGFVPSVALFVFAYMVFGFKVPSLKAAALAAATVLFCWAVFDRGLSVPWPQALLGDLLPSLRTATALL